MLLRGSIWELHCLFQNVSLPACLLVHATFKEVATLASDQRQKIVRIDFSFCSLKANFASEINIASSSK
jgi:hypothetical protein